MRRISLTAAAAVALLPTAMLPAAAQFASSPRAGTTASAEACTGMTWSMRYQHEYRGLGFPWIRPDYRTDAVAGDTPCTTTLPVMCAVADVPKPTWWTSQWPAWSGKKLRASYAVPGTSLTSRAAADRVCKSRFGENARMAEAHENGTDGSGYLGQGNPMTMWVSIDDQRANPWNTTTGRALTWAVAANETNSDYVRVMTWKGRGAHYGDTLVTNKLPVLCFHRTGESEPPGLHAYYPAETNSWSRGDYAASREVVGASLISLASANAVCSAQFGTGWRMAEFHDAWGWYAWGATKNLGRAWVANDQTNANPWD